MIQSRIIIIFLIFIQQAMLYAQQPGKSLPSVPVNFCANPAEMQLFRMINDYRKRYDLPPIPLSKSLSYVASSHVKDLFFNHPDQDPCTSYSWSDKGPWKAFCYPRDETKKNSVWDKPREFTSYKGKAYEVIYWENSSAIPDSIMAIWKSIDYVKNFLLNTGKWQGKKWNAIGIGIYENYACAWFGELIDPEGPAILCGNLIARPAVDSSKHMKLEKKKDNPNISNKELKPEISIEPSATFTGKYYIIIKSNLPMATASKLIPKLISEGYPDAKILEKEGKARVSVFESANKMETNQKLKEIRKQYKDAWILKN